MIGPGGMHDHAANTLLYDVVLAFPEYRIWRSAAFDRAQFIAQAVSLESSPHTLVTTSLEELAGELASARPDSRAAPLRSVRHAWYSAVMK
jgi:hypothetical protein